MDAGQLWERTLNVLKENIASVAYDTFIVPGIKPIEISDNTLILESVTDNYYTFITKRFLPLIESTVANVSGVAMGAKLLTPAEAKNYQTKPAEPEIPSFLNPQYTFDTFVVGNSNRFAHAASVAVAELPAEVYNPLFLYGGVGLGKTHLMHAIGHYSLKERPGTKMKYVTCETFMNELIEAIQKGKNQEFRDRYRSIDLLMIDDIQFISGATSTQEEFFHTFNALKEAGKQIVICSDRPPRDIQRLEERLRSRFEWGLVCDIQKPDLETRIAIMRKRAEEQMIVCDEDVYQMIAEKVQNNIRELEGCLTRIKAFSELTGRKIDLALAEEALHDYLVVLQPRKVNCDDVLRAVASYYHVTEEDLKGTKRNREVSVPRQIAMYLCREMTDYSMARIGDALGGKDHTTVLHGCDKIAEQLKSDESLSSVVDDLLHRLKNK